MKISKSMWKSLWLFAVVILIFSAGGLPPWLLAILVVVFLSIPLLREFRKKSDLDERQIQISHFSSHIVFYVLLAMILFGVGYSYGLDDHQTLQMTIYPFMVPGKGWPFAFNFGYGYFLGENVWRAKVGLDLIYIISPPDPDKRKSMPLLTFTPGVQYRFDDQVLLSQVWLSYFLKRANRKFSLTGIELQYGRTI